MHLLQGKRGNPPVRHGGTVETGQGPVRDRSGTGQGPVRDRSGTGQGPVTDLIVYGKVLLPDHVNRELGRVPTWGTRPSTGVHAASALMAIVAVITIPADAAAETTETPGRTRHFSERR
jgi:hypothetical protein